MVFVFYVSSAQSGMVIYKITPPTNFSEYIDTTKINKNELAKNIMLSFYKKAKAAAPYLNYTLNFQGSISSFSMDDRMGNDNGIDPKKISIYIGTKGLYYTNLNNGSVLHQFKGPLGKDLIIQSDVQDIDWEIQEKTKTIAGYKCQKAIGDVTIPGIKNGEITAWFCPELPFQFGPMEFAGLPGLILGLEQRGFYFHATEVKLDKKNRKITKPTKGELLTAEEYYESFKGFIEKAKQR